MVRDKNNNDRSILGNMDSSHGTSSSSKLCPVLRIEISHRITFCPQLHLLLSIYRKVLQKTTVFKACQQKRQYSHETLNKEKNKEGEVIIADKKSSRKTFKGTLYHIIDYDINAQDVDATMGLKKREQKEYNDTDNVDNNNYNNHRDERQQKDDQPRAIKMAEELQKEERESEQVKIDPQEVLEEEEKIQPQSQQE